MIYPSLSCTIRIFFFQLFSLVLVNVECVIQIVFMQDQVYVAFLLNIEFVRTIENAFHVRNDNVWLFILCLSIYLFSFFFLIPQKRVVFVWFKEINAKGFELGPSLPCKWALFFWLNVCECVSVSIVTDSWLLSHSKHNSTPLMTTPQCILVTWKKIYRNNDSHRQTQNRE